MGFSKAGHHVVVASAAPSMTRRSARMANFHQLQDFERRFATMGVDELKRWKTYWTQHAQSLAPKVRKQAMKRVYDIGKAIQRKSQESRDSE